MEQAEQQLAFINTRGYTPGVPCNSLVEASRATLPSALNYCDSACVPSTSSTSATYQMTVSSSNLSRGTTCRQQTQKTRLARITTLAILARITEDALSKDHSRHA
eukprot:1136864-Pelagomonas_calceolata.AAC.16